MGITIALFDGDYPYFTGSLIAPEPLPFTVNLAGVDFVIDTKQYRRNGLDTLRTGTVNSSEPNDELFDPQGAWFRYRFSFDHGAGQTVADLAPDADARRYSESVGIDPWDRYCAKLLPVTGSALVCTADVLPMIATSGFVYVGDGTGVKRSADLTAWTSITGLSGTVAAITTDGTDAYIATTADVYKVTPSSVAASAVGDGSAFDNVAFVSNRLLASSGASIGEIGAGNTFDVIFDHYQTAFRWTTIINVGSRIYVGGFAGNRSELYALEADNTGTLARAQEAAPFAYGELLRGAISYGGAVLLCTSLGIRFAQIGGDGILTYGALIDGPGDVNCATAEGRFVWFGWDEHPVGGNAAGLGRLALDEFVEVLQPAYASDVYTPGPVTSRTWSCCRFGGETLFAVSGEAVYVTDTGSYVTTGYIDTGLVYFGTVEEKRATDLLVAFHPLAGGESITAQVYDQSDNLIGSGSVATANATKLAMDLEANVADAIRLVLTVEGSGPSSTCLLRWRARAYPVAPAVEQWLVPLVIRSHVVVNDGQGQLASLDVLAQVERLIGIWRSKEATSYREGDRTYRVRIDNFELTTDQWLDDSKFFQTLMMVKLISV